MAESTIELRDVSGPYVGQVRTYTKTAGEIAMASGLAELPDPPNERQLSPTLDRAGRGEVETVVPSAETTPEPETSLSLPDDFPAASALAEAGIRTVADVPRTVDALTAIRGIGPATAGAILAELG